MKLTVAILTYNGDQLLPECLQSVQRQRFSSEDTEVLILDNGSSQPVSQEVVNQFCPVNRIVRLEANCGNIGGQNACFRYAQHDLVLFLANDVRLGAWCIISLLMFCKALDAIPKRWGQLQPLLWTPEGQVDSAGLYEQWPGYWMSNHQPGYLIVPAVPSTCYLMRKALWQALGGFDERFGSSHEDVDMGLRLHQAGYDNYLVATAFATHLGNATLRHTLTNPSQVFHRARLQLIRKHHRGADRFLRLGLIHLIDGLHRVVR